MWLESSSDCPSLCSSVKAGPSTSPRHNPHSAPFIPVISSARDSELSLTSNSSSEAPLGHPRGTLGPISVLLSFLSCLCFPSHRRRRGHDALPRAPCVYHVCVHSYQRLCPCARGAACDHLSPLCLQEADRQCPGKSCSPGVDLHR